MQKENPILLNKNSNFKNGSKNQGLCPDKALITR